MTNEKKARPIYCLVCVSKRIRIFVICISCLNIKQPLINGFDSEFTNTKAEYGIKAGRITQRSTGRQKQAHFLPIGKLLVKGRTHFKINSFFAFAACELSRYPRKLGA
jgi:hypothetical protein